MKKVFLISLFLLAALAAMPVNAQPEEVGTLTINITGFQNADGFAMVALFNSEGGFAGKEKAFRDAKIRIKDKKATCEFKDIPKGTYAVRLYHDENANGKLDKNFVGFPKEPYGVSNNAKSKTGPPKYENEKLTVAGTKIIDIKVD
jgi:uncharacterized protein (DUF2141 family)